MQMNDVLAAAAAIAGTTVPEFTESWAIWCGERQGDSDLQSTTVRDYLNPPRRRRRGAAVAAVDDDRHCTPRGASLIIEYLDTLGATNRLADPQADQQIALLMAKLETVLRKDVDRRYSNALQNDRSCHDAISRLCGTYSVIRYETGSHHYQHELLVLDARNLRHRWQSFATYIRPQIVYRGNWNVIDLAICCSLGGYAQKIHKPKTAILTICRDVNGRDDIMCGASTGIATSTGYPVVMPIILVKMLDPVIDPSVIINCSDAMLLHQFSKLPTRIMESDPRFGFLSTIRDLFPVTSIDPARFADMVRKHISVEGSVINPEVEAWCRTIRPRAMSDT